MPSIRPFAKMLLSCVVPAQQNDRDDLDADVLDVHRDVFERVHDQKDRERDRSQQKEEAEQTELLRAYGVVDLSSRFLQRPQRPDDDDDRDRLVTHEHHDEG